MRWLAWAIAFTGSTVACAIGDYGRDMFAGILGAFLLLGYVIAVTE